MTEVPLGELRDYEVRQLLKGEVVPVVFPPLSESNNTPFNVQKNLSWIEGMHVLQEERFVSGLGYNLGFMLTYYFAGVTPSYTISFASETPFTHEFYNRNRKLWSKSTRSKYLRSFSAFVKNNKWTTVSINR